MKPRICLLLTLSLLIFASCGRSGETNTPGTAQEAAQEGPATAAADESELMMGRGTIDAVQTDEHKIAIAHEAIPDLMDAATTTFSVNEQVDLRRFAAGEQVEFNLRALGADRYEIASIVREEPTSRSGAAETP